MDTAVRLQKVLSRAGIASRRRAESLIVGGRVRVNGQVVTRLGEKCDPDRDVITVDGRRVRYGALEWVALHKPRGYVCTRRDPGGRRTVYDLLPESMRTLFPVGRLDLDSEGLLLLTNDGDGAHRLLHPRFGADRVYEIDVHGAVSGAARARLLKGVRLDDGVARAHAIASLPGGGPGRCRLRLLLREGRKREVRRMLDAVGHPVIRLKRVRYGPVALGKLAAGEWRALRPAERRAIEGGAAGRASPRKDAVARRSRRGAT